MKYDTPDGANLPSHVLPCPRCGHRMIVRSTDVTDSVTHACQGCQIEVSRVIGNAVPQTRAA
jgi:transcription elongation factor Elf1